MADLALSSIDFLDLQSPADAVPSFGLEAFGYIDYGATSAAGDAVPPVVTLVSPPANSFLAQSTPIVIDVTDNVAVRRSFLVVRFPSLGLEEVVHQGDRFSAFYSGASSRVAVAGGFRYTLLRAGGWPAAPVVDAYAIDTAGLEPV